jgi:hypothetical protein
MAAGLSSLSERSSSVNPPLAAAFGFTGPGSAKWEREGSTGAALLTGEVGSN